MIISNNWDTLVLLDRLRVNKVLIPNPFTNYFEFLEYYDKLVRISINFTIDLVNEDHIKLTGDFL